MLKSWHRRIGVLSALFVLLLSVTGFVLNHTSTLKLDQWVIHSPRVLEWYGIELPVDIYGVEFGKHWISSAGDRLFFDRQPIGRCTGELTGAIAVSNQVIVACQYDLLILTDEGALIEQVDHASGLTIPLTALGEYQGEVVFKAAGQLLYFHPDTLKTGFYRNLSHGESESLVSWSQRQLVGDELGDFLAPLAVSELITLERLVLDIHSGRIAGSWGVYLMDVMAVLFVLMAISGVIMWRRTSKQD